MNFKPFVSSPASVLRGGSLLALTALLSACSLFGGGSAPKPKPAELPPIATPISVRQAWNLRIPQVKFPLQVAVSGDVVTVAGSDGLVVAIDARTGLEAWRGNAGAPLSAGVGSDGSIAAVITTGNELVALSGGKVLWRQKLSAESYTAPLVAGRRVFVQTADRTISAHDGQSGQRLWVQQRSGADLLVLRKPGVLMAVGDTLVTGVGGRLVGVNPGNGSSRWEMPIAAPRGTNEVERMVDLVSGVSRVGDSVCARAYYANVGCVDTQRGMLVWNRPATGAEGVSGDEQLVYGTEANGVVTAWRRADGERAWQMESLRYRTLTAPLAVGRAIVVGDESGLVHFLSRDDGKALNRLPTDGSGIAATPAISGNTVVVVTRNGGVYGYRPD